MFRNSITMGTYQQVKYYIDNTGWASETDDFQITLKN